MRTHVYGVLGSLDFLKKGGRIGGAAHLVGSLLSIKPVIEVRDGVVEVESKQRTRSRALQYLASKVTGAGALDRLAVANGAADDIDEVSPCWPAGRSGHPLVVGDSVRSSAPTPGPAPSGVCFTTVAP